MTSPQIRLHEASIPPALTIFQPGASPRGVFLSWDDGRLLIDAEFATLFERHGLTTFAAIAGRPLESIARQVGERVTGRFSLGDDRWQSRAFFLKRHGPPRWRERFKAWLRLTRPVLGARAEWQAMLWFQELAIPAPRPVVLGESQGESFTIATAIEPHTRLDHWWEDPARDAEWRNSMCRRQWVIRLARQVRRLHAAGLHHQDLYLCHLLLTPDRPEEITIIDLGRVRRHRSLPLRWIIKDLSQLHFSSPRATLTERLRFLREYLGRHLNSADRSLVARVLRKSLQISRHTRRNGL